MTKHEYIIELFKLNPNMESKRIYDELRNKYKQEVVFEEKVPNEQEWDTDRIAPAEIIYKCTDRKWIIRIFDHGSINLDRLISHELLHALLRFRNNLPFINQQSAIQKQIQIIDEIDHKIFNAELDRVFGQREMNREQLANGQVLKSINKFLQGITSNIDGEQYKEIVRQCVVALNEEMPDFLFDS